MPSAVDKAVAGAWRYAFELGGVLGGYLHSVEGGNAVADVVEEKPGPDHIVHKHIAGVKYEDITLACGTGMSKAFYEWIKASFDLKPMRPDGSIKVLDFDSNIISEMDFFHGLLTEIGFPALDAASKDAAELTIKISPEYTRYKKGSGKLEIKQAIQKKWLPANFRLTISGLDCTRVNKVEALTLTKKVGARPAGEKGVTNLEVPHLVVTLAEATAEKFYEWHRSFVIDGKNGKDQEKNGTLEYLTPDLKEALFELAFHGLGIFRLTPEKLEAGGENIRRVKAEMYCQSIDFKYGAGATWA